MRIPTAEEVRLSNEWFEECISRNFSKRQLKVLGLLGLLTLGSTNKLAYIPQLLYFEQIGIDRSKITKELDYLAKNKIIVWHREEKLMGINMNFKQWEVEKHSKFSSEKFHQLLDLNIERD